MNDQPSIQQSYDDFESYNHAWQEMMITIWKDRMALLGHKGTGANISQEIKGGVDMVREQFASLIHFEIPSYGVYWVLGVGNGYTRGPENGGDLEILDPVYRIEHKLNVPRLASTKAEGRKTTGHPRQRHIQPVKSYAYSKKVLLEACMRIVGDGFLGALTELNGEVKFNL